MTQTDLEYQLDQKNLILRKSLDKDDGMKTELLLPAGTLDKMRAAYDFGADAVYAGQPRYSLRARNNDFNNKTLKIGIEEAHARSKKLYVASNIMPHNRITSI